MLYQLEFDFSIYIKKTQNINGFLKTEVYFSMWKKSGDKGSRTWGDLITLILSLVPLYPLSSCLPSFRSAHGLKWLYSIQKEIEGSKNQKPSSHMSQSSLNTFHWRLIKHFYSTFHLYISGQNVKLILSSK